MDKVHGICKEVLSSESTSLNSSKNTTDDHENQKLTNSKDDSKNSNFEDVFDQIGHFKIYQKYAAVTALIMAWPAGFSTLLPIFTHLKSDYSCVEFSDSNPINFTQNTKIDSCGIAQITSCQTSCTNYEFKNQIFDSTVVSDFQLVCQDWPLFPDGALTLVGMVFFVGSAAGALINGYIADAFGRKKSAILGCLVGIISEISTTYSTTWQVYGFFRFSAAIGAMMVYSSGFIIGQELLGSRQRLNLGICMSASFTAAWISLVGIAYILQEIGSDWRVLVRIVSSGYVVCLICLAFLYESPRWLLTQGKSKEATQVLQNIADKNGVKTTVICPRLDKTTGQQYGFLETVKLDRRITKGIMFNAYLWSANALVYYGLSMNSASLPGSVFFNNLMAAGSEYPMYMIMSFLMKRFGRRRMTSYCFFLAGVSCLIATVTFEIAKKRCESTNLKNPWVIMNLMFSFFGKTCIAGSFGSVWIWSCELFPTEIRGSAVGISSTGARFGSLLTPFLIGLQNLVSWLPGTVFGLVSILAGVVSLLLPETLGKALPMSIEDGIRMFS